MVATPAVLLSLATIAQSRVVSRQVGNSAAAGSADVVYDGRVAANAATADFDTAGPFGSENVKGDGNHTLSTIEEKLR
jgi:hypothetical protein